MTPIARSRVHGFLLASFLATVALAAGCATQSQYTYVPIGPGASGGPAAQYPVPPAAPQGSVYVTSFGFTDFDAGPGAGPQRLLHARLAVSNGSAMPWEVDGRQQFLAAPGLEPQAPSFMNTNAGNGPIYPVAPGAANVFDLYFALPPGLGQPQNLGGFALDWNVNAAGQVVANQTSFERMNGVAESYDPYPPYVVVGLGFGVGWWYSPFYPYGHYPPVIRGYYYGPRRAWGGPYRGAPPGAWRGAPRSRRLARGARRRGAGAGRRRRPAGGEGAAAGVRASRVAPAPAPAPRGGGWRGGGGRRH